MGTAKFEEAMISSNRLISMVHPERFERPTPRFVVWCSIQLSYGCLPKEGGHIQAGFRACKPV